MKQVPITAIVCVIRAFTMEHAFSAHQVIEFHLDRRSRYPAPPVIPLLEISHDGSKLLNTDWYISITIPFSIPCWKIEFLLDWSQHDMLASSIHSQMEYRWWCMIILGDQDRSFAIIIHPEEQHEGVIVEGIIPLLEHRFNLSPENLPECFKC